MAETPDGLETFHIGRLAIADEQSDPVVVDWRAPVAEPFYRATGREPMGLARRRHFAVHGRTLLGSKTSCSATATSVSAMTTDCDGRRRRQRARQRLARLQHAARRARARSHRPARRHRRHDPGASRTRSSAARKPACWWCRVARHRQDRRCAAPRRVPAVHVPLPSRGPGGAGHRAQPGVPALHRAGPAIAGRGRHRAGRAQRPGARRGLGALRRRSARLARDRNGQGRHPHGRRHRPRR